MTRKIGVVTGTRAEYGYLRPLISAIEDNPSLELLLYVTGMHLLEDYGNSLSDIREEGHRIHEIVEMVSKPMMSDYDLAQSIGTGVKEFSNSFRKSKPDVVVVFGDRTEPFAASIAAVTMNIPVAHIAGGEIGSGDIDHIMRHAITKLSHLHFTQSELSKERVIRLGEETWRVHNVGSLSLDTILNTDIPSRASLSSEFGLSESEFILVVFHPTSTEWDEAGNQFRSVLGAAREVGSDRGFDIVVIYPNDYPGGTKIIEEIQEIDEKNRIHVFRNLSHPNFLSMMKEALVFVGNSSSGIIEAPSLATPYVCVGKRQEGRERAMNVIDTGYNQDEIRDAIEKAAFDSSFRDQVEKKITPYGDGNAAKQIVDILKEIDLGKKLLQKKMTY